MKRGRKFVDLVIKKQVCSDDEQSSTSGMQTRPVVDLKTVFEDFMERPAKVACNENHQQVQQETLPDAHDDESVSVFVNTLEEPTHKVPAQELSPAHKNLITPQDTGLHDEQSIISGFQHKKDQQNIILNDYDDESISIIDNSVEEPSNKVPAQEFSLVRSELITPQDLGLHDDQQPSTSGLQRGPVADFDSDDSVADTNWEPPRIITRISDSGSTSTEEDIDSSTATNNLSNLREIIYDKKHKNRKSLKLRRSEITSNKHLRNTGQEYFSRGKLRPARQMKELSICRSNCKGKISSEAREDLFKSYWQLGSYEKRVDYISSLIFVEEKKVEKVNATKHRDCSFGYYIHWGTELHEKVCKNYFVLIFGETHKFVTIQANRKKQSYSGTIPASRRGLNSHPKWTESDLHIAREHILSFPQYESHYGRNKTNKKFLPSHLNLDLMYTLYCKDRPKQETVCKTIYGKIFASLNLSFKPPKVDTCTTCDKLNAQIKHTVFSEKAELIKQLNEHQERAQKAYAEKKKDKALSLDDDSLLVLTFDLQQCLPTPLLSSGTAFYKRSLWTFNLTIHNCKTKQATCFMWHEATGKRGGNNIASCLYNYIINLPPSITNIILYSDTCAGQNKNSFVSAMFLTIIDKCPHIKCIDHKFLVPGHTHMECDYDHSVIERAKKKFADIHHPRDYYQMVRSAGKRGQLTVKEMNLENFFNFEKLLKGPLVLRKMNTVKEKVHWPDICWFRYRQNDFIVDYKNNLDSEEDFKKLSFKRSAKKDVIIELELISETPLPISGEKKRDLLLLLPFIDREFHDFYKNLLSDESISSTEDPDLDIFLYQQYQEEGEHHEN